MLNLHLNRSFIVLDHNRLKVLNYARKILHKFKIHNLLFITVILLNGCNAAILDPKGQVGLYQRSLIITVFGLMLIIVIPAILMTVMFAWRYGLKSKKACYFPDWTYSSKIEIIVWTVPVLIIMFIAILTWKSTHFLDPSKSIVNKEKPIKIEVVSMDWKWFFIYPEQGIATINEIVFPVNTPIHFKLTSNSVMNSFFISRLGSQIYTMAGMITNLHLIANEVGIYNGCSTNYSGHGFSGMKFQAIATSNRDEFDNWILKVKKSYNVINNMTTFEQIAKPTTFNKVEYFSSVKLNLFKEIINKFMMKM